MLEDFYSDFFPASVASPGGQGLRESCRPSENTAPAWGVQRLSEPRQSQSAEEEEAALCRETLLRGAGGPGGELGRPDARSFKVPRPAAPTASRSGRPPSPELLVPDSDYWDDDEAESESEWRHCRPIPQAGGPAPPHRQPAGGEEPGGRGDPWAGLGAAAGGEAAAPGLQTELWGAVGPARPGLWPEGEEVIGGCGRPASPRSLADLEDQVLGGCWLPEE